MHRQPDSDFVKLSMSCLCSDEIFKNGGKEMIEENFKDFLLPESEGVAGYAVTLGVDVNKLPAPLVIKKSMDEETKEKVREENIKIRE